MNTILIILIVVFVVVIPLLWSYLKNRSKKRNLPSTSTTTTKSNQCPIITDLKISQSMGYINLDSLNFSPTPAGNTLVDVYYKLASDPDVIGSYTLFLDNWSVPPNGDLNFDITGLLDNTAYTIWIVPVCGGPGYKEDFITGNTQILNINTNTDNSITNITFNGVQVPVVGGYPIAAGFTSTTGELPQTTGTLIVYFSGVLSGDCRGDDSTGITDCRHPLNPSETYTDFEVNNSAQCFVTMSDTNCP